MASPISLTIIMITISLLLSLSTPLPTPHHRFSKIFAFGDSFTDTGNTRSITGPYNYKHVSNLPYGITFFHRSTNRYSDGRLVVDFLASALSLPFLPPYLAHTASPHGVNFAVAGSTAIDHEFFVKNNISMDITPQSLSTELKWFDEYLGEKGCRARGSPECKKVMEGALFWVGEIGVNDYAYSFTSSVTTDTIRELGVKSLDAFIQVCLFRVCNLDPTSKSDLQALLERGAKHIIVQGLPLTGCLPLTMVLAAANDRDDIGCSASVNSYIHLHNSLIQTNLQRLRRQYPTATIAYADYATAHRTVMKNPSLYGFSERFKVCCGAGGDPYNYEVFSTCGSPDVRRACQEPSKYVNWDGVHFTEAMYEVVADMFFKQGYTRPPFQSFVGP